MRIGKHEGDRLANQSAKITQDLAKVHEKLATGKRINRASDDAAGLAMAKEFEKMVRGYRNASENISAGMSALTIADGSSSTINDMLQRQRELAIQSANGLLNPSQREALDREFQALSQEIDRTSKSSSFNGQNLLDGSSALSDGNGKLQAGAQAGQHIDMPHTDLSLNSLNMGTAKVDSLDGALRALNAIDAAMKRVNDTRATNGGLSNRLESALNNLGNQMINTTKGLSAIEDMDMAQGITEKVRNDILKDTNSAALSQFNQISRSHLLALFQ